VHYTQISAVFECQGQRSKVKVTRDIIQETAESSPLTMHSKVRAIGGMQQAATDDTTASPPGGDRLRRWVNQRMPSSFVRTFQFSVSVVCHPETPPQNKS